MHPLFARLDRQLALATKEFSNVEAAEARDLKLKKMGSGLYNKWAHNASIAEGIRAIYGGLESILLTIAKATDAFDPSGESWHADLIGTMADPLEEERDSPVEGLTHRYPDRVLLLVTDVCSMYCRRYQRENPRSPGQYSRFQTRRKSQVRPGTQATPGSTQSEDPETACPSVRTRLPGLRQVHDQGRNKRQPWRRTAPRRAIPQTLSLHSTDLVPRQPRRLTRRSRSAFFK